MNYDELLYTTDKLDITIDFLENAIRHYENKYGICTSYNNYTIYFIPVLSIIKRL